MIRWFQEAAPLRRKMDIMLGAVVAPMALTWGIATVEYVRVAGAAHHEVASNYMQVLRFGMEATLASSTVALALSVAAALWMGGRIVSPVAEAVASLDDLAAGDLDGRAVLAPRGDEAGRIVAATTLLRLAAISSLEAAAAYAIREAAAAAERERVMAALAEGLGALAASNRQLRLGDSAPLARPVRPVLQLAPEPQETPALPPEPGPVGGRGRDIWPQTPAEDGLVDLLLRLDHRRGMDSDLRLVAV